VTGGSASPFYSTTGSRSSKLGPGASRAVCYHRRVSVRSIAAIIVLGCCFGLSARARAQTTPHVEIEGGVQLPTGIVPVREPSNFPRQVPNVTTRDLDPVEAAIGARVFVVKRFNVRTTYAWSRTTTVHLAYDRPPQNPVFSGYTSEITTRDHHRGLTVVPSLDLVDSGRIRPWVGAGAAWRWSNDDETRTAIEFQSGAVSTDREISEDTERMLVASGGMRIVPAQRVVLGASVRWNFLRTTPQTVPVRPPRSPRFVVDFSAGVAF
jgi:hypothetical protein